MRERSGWLAAFLAISAAVFHTASGSGEPSADTLKNSDVVVTASSEHGSTGERELLKNFDEFYVLNAPWPTNKTLSGRITTEHKRNGTFSASFAAEAGDKGLPDRWWRSRLQNRYDWIIATVPDPELCDLKLNFDREVNSLQNAAESAGYHFDRYWFPWKDADAAKSSGNEDQEDDSRRNLPGILLFRASPENLDPQTKRAEDLVVFLVGETPTSGIAAAPFKNAVRLGEFSKREVPIKIAGPGFSGSFPSLEKVLDGEQPAEIYTWTSDSQSQTVFQTDRPKAKLKASTDSSARLMERFCFYLRRTWKEKHPIVLLVEESTAFGSGFVTSMAEKRGELEPIYVVKFPRGISKLRNATEDKQQIPGFEGAKSTGAIARQLPFTLKDEQTGKSELPFYSKEQSPVSQESVLLSIASLMKKSSLHYAGIIATDPLDLLFLTRFLHSASPNTRVFTQESDLLFQHGADGSGYAGLLTVTNYPLFAYNQIWTGSANDGTLQIFPSGNAESIYNAVIELLPAGVHSRQLREYADPFALGAAARKPPLWVTVASGNGYAPVDVLGANDETGDLKLAPSFLAPADSPAPQDSKPRWIPEYWQSWGYCFTCLCCLCIVYAAAVLLARPEGSRFLAIFSVKPKEERPLPRAQFLFLLGLCLSVLLAMWLVAPFIVMVQNNAQLPVGWRMGTLLQVCWGVALINCVRLLARDVTEPLRWKHWASVAFTGALSILSALSLNLNPLGRLRTAAIAAIPLIASAVAPASQFVFGTKEWQEKKVKVLAWRSLAVTAIGLALALAICLCRPQHKPDSDSLLKLWVLLRAGAVVLGMSIAAAAIPLLEGIESTRKGKCALRRDLYFWSSLVAAVAGLALLFGAWMIFRDPPPQQFLAACRAINITSGVCPLVPLTLSLLSLAFWCFVQLRRVTYHDDQFPDVPDLPHDPFCPESTTLVKDMKKLIAADFFHPVYNLVAVFGVLLALGLCAITDRQTVEPRAIDRAIICLGLLVSLSLLMIMARFTLIWSAFREFLQQLERHPLREVFNCLPRGFLWAPMWQGGGKKRTHVAVARSLECMRALVNNPKVSRRLTRVLLAKQSALEMSAKQLLTAAAERRRVSALFHRELQQQLCSIGTLAATELAQNKWPLGSYEAKEELANRDRFKDALQVSRHEFEVEEPYTMAGELLALRLLPFINYVVLQLQNLAIYLSGGFILLIAAMNSYAFRARTVIDWFLAVLFLLLGSTVVTVFSQLDRDAIFSRITRTEQGKLDRNFVFHVISYGAVPTLALLASHVPFVAKFFFSWIKPAMEAIH